MQGFSTLLAFLLITIVLLIAVSIYCYLIKYQTKQKHLLPFQVTKMINKVKDITIKKTTHITFLMILSV